MRQGTRNCTNWLLTAHQPLQWRIGSLLYSLGVSIKMNVLLFAPGLLLLLLQHSAHAPAATNAKPSTLLQWMRRYSETVSCLAICAAVQLLLGAPFLATFPVEYISRAFNFGRVFMYR